VVSEICQETDIHSIGSSNIAIDSVQFIVVDPVLYQSVLLQVMLEPLLLLCAITKSFISVSCILFYLIL